MKQKQKDCKERAEEESVTCSPKLCKYRTTMYKHKRLLNLSEVDKLRGLHNMEFDTACGSPGNKVTGG
jgi:hypothetical protein